MRQIREGGFQTRPYNSRFFFAPFAFFAAILFFRLRLRRAMFYAANSPTLDLLKTI